MEGKKKAKKKKKGSKKISPSDGAEAMYKKYLNQEEIQTDEKWKDNLFPPNETSLLGKETAMGETKETNEQPQTDINVNEIEWKRAKNICAEPHIFENEIDFKNVGSGIITNSYFLSAIAALCKYPSLISKIFITKECTDHINKLLLFIDGEFQIVYLDDFFPCCKGTSIPYFSKTNTFELWIMLLEKAWAKINGGYANILKGNPSEVFKTFTGFCCEQLDHQHDDIDKIWDAYKVVNNDKGVIVVSTGDNSELEQVGLIPNHTYILTDIVEVANNGEIIRLCKLKNPLGTNEWKGDWGNQSDIWTDEINKQINEDVLHTNKDECFMSLNDLVNNFIRSDICHILFDAKSKTFDFNLNNGINDPQIFNFCLNSPGNVSIAVLGKNNKNVSHPTSLLVAEYDPDNKEFKNIYSDYESYKDIEKTIQLNPGNYLVWVYKGVYESEEPKPEFMKVKFISSSPVSVKHVGNDPNFEIAGEIIYDGIRKEKQNEISSSEIFYDTKNEFQNSGIAYKLVINPLSTCYQKWDVDANDTKDFIILPPYRGQNNFKLEVGPKDHAIILSLRNKKYGEFCFNVKVDAEEFECSDGEKPIVPKQKPDFDSYCLSDTNSFEPLDNQESGSFDELSNKEKYPTCDLPKLFGEKYRNECKHLDEVVKMEPADTDKKLRWSKIQEDNGTYYGETDQNLPEGRGCFVYKGDNGLEWVGYFKDGSKGNYGKLYNKRGKLVYEGEYKNGVRNGEGTYYYNNGDKYEGEFVNGVRDGNGTFYWGDGPRWEGTFKENEMNGEGTYYTEEDSYPVSYNKGEVVQ